MSNSDIRANSRVFFSVWIVVLLLGMVSPVVKAQTGGTGALTGTVTDSSGAVIPNVTVTVTSADTGQVRTTMTRGDGTYTVGLLPPGDYRVKFEATGFQVTEVPSATVTVTETGTLNQALKVGSQTQAVTVEANVETLQTTSSTLGTVLQSKTVTDLPLNTRNFTNLLGLSAGANSNVQNASVLGKGTASTAVNGASPTQNNYQQDGVSVNNWNSTVGMAGGEGGSSGFIALPNPDAIEEFKIQTSNYDASYGRNPGAAVNVVTKSGTNDFHGTAFEFFRNTALNANDWFLKRSEFTKGQPNVEGVLNQNQFGGAIGGPIIKNKLLFFFSYQETKQKNGVTAGSLSSVGVPFVAAGDRTSAAWLNSMYAFYCNQRGSGTGAGAAGGAVIANPTPTACANPLPAGVTAGTVGTVPFSPVAIAILQLKLADGSYYIPTSPNIAPGQFTGSNSVAQIAFSSPAYYTEHQPIFNFDYIINSKHTFSGRYFYSIDPQKVPLVGATSPPGFPANRSFTNETAMAKLTSVLSTNFVNEARVSYQRYITNNAAQTTFTKTQVGMGAGILGTRRIDLPAMSFPFMLLGQGVFNGAYLTTNQIQAADQISWNKGKHTVRAGFEYQFNTRYYDFNALMIGQLNFPSTMDFLIGRAGCTPGDATCSPTNPGATNGDLTLTSNVNSTSNAVRPGIGGLLANTPQNGVSAFVQDDITVNRKLTVNLGLRWEYNGYLKEDAGKLTNTWLSLTKTVPFPLVASPCTSNGLSSGTPIIFPTPCAGDSYAGFVVPANYNASVYGAPPPGVFQNSLNSSPRTKPQLDNFGPRLGFAWQPLSNGRLVVRSGGGIFYHENSADDFYVPAARQAPYAVNVPRTGSANFFATLASPFDPTPVGWAPRWYTVDKTNPNNITGLSSNLSFPQVQENWKTPVAYQYNLSIQYELVPNWVLEIGYVGSRSVHQYQATSTDGVRYNAAQLASSTNPINCGYDGNPAHCVTTTTTANAFLRVPFLGWAPSAYKFGPNESGKYNSAQVTLRKQFSHGLQFQGAYTFSRGFSTGADLTAPVLEYRGVNNATGNPIQPVYQPDQAYHPHRFTASYHWDLPLGHPSGAVGKAVMGWAVSGVATIQNGVPLTVTDPLGGTAFGSPLLGTLAQLSGTGPIGTPGGVSKRVDGYFNGAAFQCGTKSCIPTLNDPSLGCGGAGQGTCGTGFGNSPYGVLYGPGQNSYDISLSKDTTVGGIRENATLQFRAEFFNAFNHPQFSNPSGSTQTAFTATGTATPAPFGKITSLSVNPRLIQFALKYAF